MSVSQVANELGISHEIIYRWFRNPVFTAALELRTRENFINVGRFKTFQIYNREMNKANPGSRILEHIAKSMGFFSDNDQISIEVNVDATGAQVELERGRDGAY